MTAGAGPGADQGTDPPSTQYPDPCETSAAVSQSARTGTPFSGRSWRIRRAGPEDAGCLALVGGATFLETFAGILSGDAIIRHCQAEHRRSAYRDLLALGTTAAWVAEAENGGAPIGYALAGAPALALAEATDLELKRLYCFSRFHGSGLGAELMAGAIHWASAAGARRLLLGVYNKNERALAFYGRQGFRAIGVRHFRVGHQTYEDVVLGRALGA